MPRTKTPPPAYVTKADIAAARRVSVDAVGKALETARARARDRGGVWPIDAIPEPDETRPVVRWRSDRPEVVEYMRSGVRNRAPEVTPAWVLAQCGAPPAGAGRSVRDVARETGLSPSKVSIMLREAGGKSKRVVKKKTPGPLDGYTLAQLRDLEVEHGSQKAAAASVPVTPETWRVRVRQLEALEASGVGG